MISDSLFNFVHDVRRYLDSEDYAHVYTGKLRDRIEAVVAEADVIRAILDTPPSARTPDESP